VGNITLQEAIVKFVAGGSLILLISLLGKSRYNHLSGMMVLFPVVTVIGYYFLSSYVPGDRLQRIVLFSILSLPTVLVFLLVLYFALNRMAVIPSLMMGITAWLVTAGLITLIDYKFLGLWNVGS
jgi:membrane protein GlpM